MHGWNWPQLRRDTSHIQTTLKQTLIHHFLDEEIPVTDADLIWAQLLLQGATLSRDIERRAAALLRIDAGEGAFTAFTGQGSHMTFLKQHSYDCTDMKFNIYKEPNGRVAALLFFWSLTLRIHRRGEGGAARDVHINRAQSVPLFPMQGHLDMLVEYR